jgi:hypothetical protein
MLGTALLVESADRLKLPPNSTAGRPQDSQAGPGTQAAGKVLANLAVMLADGGACLSAWPSLGSARPLGPVAAAPTAWRIIEHLAQVGERGLAGLRLARA